MHNKVKEGCTIEFAAEAELKGGDLVLVGLIPAVVLYDVVAEEVAVAETDGVYRVPKIAGVAMVQGTAVSYITASKSVQTAAPGAGLGYTGIGTVWDAALAADTEVNIKLSTKHAVAVA